MQLTSEEQSGDVPQRPLLPFFSEGLRGPASVGRSRHKARATLIRPVAKTTGGPS